MRYECRYQAQQVAIVTVLGASKILALGFTHSNLRRLVRMESYD